MPQGERLKLVELIYSGQVNLAYVCLHHSDWSPRINNVLSFIIAHE